MRIKITVSALVLSLSSIVCAQGLYKIVGPDGKVTYSDKPPPEVGSNYETLRQTPSASATSVPVNPNQASSASNSLTHQAGAKRAIKAAEPAELERPSRQASPAAPDPSVEKAVIGVLGIDDMVRRTVDLCVQTLPTSFGKYTDAKDAWTQRNLDVVRLARVALTKNFNSEEARTIETAIQLRNQTSMTPVTSAAMASKISWCDRSVDEIRSGKMDVYNNSRLAEPLKR